MGLRIQNNVEAFNTHRQLTGTAAKAAKVDGEALLAATASTVRPTTPPASPSPRRCAARSAASLRRSATRRTASRSSRRRKVPSTRCTRCCSASVTCKVQYDNGTLLGRRQGRDRRRGRRSSARRSTTSSTQDQVQRHGRCFGVSRVHLPGRRQRRPRPSTIDTATAVAVAGNGVTELIDVGSAGVARRRVTARSTTCRSTTSTRRSRTSPTVRVRRSARCRTASSTA